MSLKRKAVELAASDAKKPKANASITSFFGAPKPVAGSSAKSKITDKADGSNATDTSAPDAAEQSAKVPFDKKAWAEKLTAEQRDLLGLEVETLHETWFKELKDVFLTDSFLGLKRFLKKEYDAGKKIYPPAADVYSWYAPSSCHANEMSKQEWFN